MPDRTSDARFGLLHYLDGQGGSASLGELHQHSQIRYGAAHTDFSVLVQSLSSDEFVTYSDQVFQLTERGRDWLARNGRQQGYA